MSSLTTSPVQCTLSVRAKRSCACVPAAVELPDAVSHAIAPLHRTFMSEASSEGRQAVANKIGQHLAAWCRSRTLPGSAVDSYVVRGDRVTLFLHRHAEAIPC